VRSQEPEVFIAPGTTATDEYMDGIEEDLEPFDDEQPVEVIEAIAKPIILKPNRFKFSGNV
ncbi:MAG: hypothetical protein F6J98_05540, partial [Moorea sp. SIO4G2]|nr:hypothetical protein [Moorena sp. SIO4G2]